MEFYERDPSLTTVVKWATATVHELWPSPFRWARYRVQRMLQLRHGDALPPPTYPLTESDPRDQTGRGWHVRVVGEASHRTAKTSSFARTQNRQKKASWGMAWSKVVVF